MSAPRFTKAEKDAILDAYAEGESAGVIAARFGCDPSYPGLLTRRRGMAGRKRGAQRRLDHEGIIKAHQAGDKMEWIAHTFGCSVDRAYVIVRTWRIRDERRRMHGQEGVSDV